MSETPAQLAQAIVIATAARDAVLVRIARLATTTVTVTFHNPGYDDEHGSLEPAEQAAFLAGVEAKLMVQLSAATAACEAAAAAYSAALEA